MFYGLVDHMGRGGGQLLCGWAVTGPLPIHDVERSRPALMRYKYGHYVALKIATEIRPG